MQVFYGRSHEDLALDSSNEWRFVKHALYLKNAFCLNFIPGKENMRKVFALGLKIAQGILR